jgi:AcrR family transcriptional regulator
MTERLTRAQQQEVTRTRLLDAAEKLFGDRGIPQTSLDGIAAEAGLTKGAIYANFAGKDDLIAAILERKLSTEEPADPGRTPAGWIDDLGGSWARNVESPEVRRFALAFVEFWLLGMRDAKRRDAVMRWLATVRELNGKEAAAVAGAGLAMPADRLGALMVALDIGIAMQHLIDPRSVPADLYQAGLQAIVGGTGAKPRTGPGR